MNRKLILLVEDNPDDVALTLDAFQQANIVSQTAILTDGAAALDYLLASGPYAGRDRAEMPAVVLLDLKLPKVDGLEVLRQVRANPQTKRLPIVVLTSSREERDLLACYILGANSYIRKPVDYDEFLETVKQLGRYWLSLNEAPPSHSEQTESACPSS